MSRTVSSVFIEVNPGTTIRSCPISTLMLNMATKCLSSHKAKKHKFSQLRLYQIKNFKNSVKITLRIMKLNRLDLSLKEAYNMVLEAG